MKKTLRTVICIILVISALSIPMALAAMESNLYIDSYSAATSAKGNGLIRVDFGAHGTGLLDDLGASKIRIYENGSLVKTYLSSNPLYSASMMGHNTWIFYGGVNYQGTAGNTYYAEVTIYGGDGSGSDTEVYQTASVGAT